MYNQSKINTEVNVPEKTIAVIPFNGFDTNNLEDFLIPLKGMVKRDWFGPNHYKCLPLLIGNQYGFGIKIPFGFSVFWNGGIDKDDLYFILDDDEKLFRDKNTVSIESHFGYGIFTITIPVVLKTPPGINLMTIAPPNFLLPGLTPMTGVVESDNIRFIFTINIKVNMPSQNIYINKNTILASIIPIPRYFVDEFTIISSSDVFDEDIINKELLAQEDNLLIRRNLGEHDRCYFNGTDIYGNKFKDHQGLRAKSE